MTIKELADVAGVSEDTIRRKGKSLFPGMSRRGVRTVYTDNQSRIIMAEVKKKNMVSEVPQSAEVVPQSAVVDYESIGKMIGMAVSAALAPVVERLDNISQAKALPAPVNEDYYSLLAYCKIKGITVNRSELALHGKNLKRFAVEEGHELHKVPDERWGHVNSYPVALLDEYFEV